jgi:hypothetical protein
MSNVDFSPHVLQRQFFTNTDGSAGHITCLITQLTYVLCWYVALFHRRHQAQFCLPRVLLRMNTLQRIERTDKLKTSAVFCLEYQPQTGYIFDNFIYLFIFVIPSQ